MAHFFGPMMAECIVGVGYVAKEAAHGMEGSQEAEGGVTRLNLNVPFKMDSQWSNSLLIISTP